MAFFKWIVCLPLAAIVTAALFFMMAQLVGRDQPLLDSPQSPPKVKIIATKTDSPPTPAPPKPLILEAEPPEIDVPTVLPGPKPGPSPVSPKREDMEKIPVGTEAIGAPVIKHAPLYPEACRAHGAAGVVIVQFDVTPEGNVVNVVVLESPHRCFNRPVRNTVAKWKYPPAVKNGRFVMRLGVVERIHFELVD